MPAQLDRAAELTSLGDRPLGVVTAGKGSQPGWTAHQNDLAKLSANGFHRTVAGSTHQSLIDDETDGRPPAAPSATSSSQCATSKPRNNRAMPRYLLHHEHGPAQCGAVFASFHASPLRHQPTIGSCRLADTQLVE